MQNERFTISGDAAGLRLDVFLTSVLEDESRSQIKKAIEGAEITVNGYPVKSGYDLREGDEVVIAPKTKPVDPLDLTPADIPLDIVYEDESIIVINKAAGMVVHPGLGKERDTLVHALLHHTRGQMSSMGDVNRPGIVHRLDKGTTGLIVCAKSNQAHRHLQEQFRDHSAFRVYQAITWHPYGELTGKVETYLGQSREDPRMQVVMEDNGRAKLAITRYKVVEQYPYLNLVRFKLETGRTHQIRAHSKFLGHPIFGDDIYSGSEKQIKSVNVHYQKFARNLLNYIDHQALHAFRLEITHPLTNKRMEFKAEMPPELFQLLEKLRNKYPDYLRYED